MIQKLREFRVLSSIVYETVMNQKEGKQESMILGQFF